MKGTLVSLGSLFLLSAFISLMFGIFLYGKNPSHIVNRLLLLLSGFLFYWGSTEFLYFQASDVQSALLWIRVGACWYFIPAFVLHFSATYSDIKLDKRLLLISAYVPAALASFLEGAGLTFQPRKFPWGWDQQMNYIGDFALIWVASTSIVSLVILYVKYRRAETPEEKIGAGAIFVAFLIPIVVGLTTAFVLPVLLGAFPDFTMPAVTFGFFLAGYVVWRYGTYTLTFAAAADEVLSTMQDALFLANSSWRILASNKAASTLFGYEKSEFTGMPLNALAQDSSSVEAMLGDSHAPIFVTDFKTKQGLMIPVSISRSSILTKHRTLVGHIVVCRDITALLESEKRFRELAELLPQLVFETDERGALTFFNRAGLSSLGYTEQDFLGGFDAFQAFPPEDARRAIENMRRVMGGEGIGPNEYSMFKKDGTSIPVLIYSNAIIRDRKPVGLRGIIVDITERKKLESQLVESQRLAAIGETTTMVGHDLRNPLQAMTVAVHLVKKLVMSQKPEERKEAVELLSTLDDTIRYMDKIVSDLQDYARPVGADLIEANLPDLINAAVSNVKVPGDVQVAVDLHNGASGLRLDTTLFTRVLTNLILNALQAMPDGGKLTIEGSCGEGSVMVGVKDTGVGIAPENLAKIFNPFFTTKARGQGLGLAVCRRLIEAQGGRIDVTSQVGKGSAFTFKIPTNGKPMT